MKTANATEKTTTTAEMTTGSVTSKDGTQIGYLRTGQGPAVVVLHGSNESARSHTRLALALAGAFTVYLPDRRGRGLSGPHRPDHSMRTEVEHLQAVVAHSGARRVFGVSVSALIALQAARTAPPSARSRPTSRPCSWTPPAGTPAGCAASTGRWPAARWRTR